MLIYSYAIYLTLHGYIFFNNFFKIKQLRKDKNKMENQEILILKIKNQKDTQNQKKTTKRREEKLKKSIIVKIIVPKNKNLLKGIVKSKTI